MKITQIITVLSALFLFSCSQEVPFAEQKKIENCSAVKEPPPVEVKVTTTEITALNWGPQNTKIGVNPNLQPDGSMGLWFKFNSTKGLTKVVLYFDGKPAIGANVIDSTLITAAVSAALLDSPGVKSVSLRNEITGLDIFKGSFEVLDK